jgi:hypothetical protein
MVNDVLIFESDTFSVEPPLSERGLRYDLPLGDDIAAHLKERLARKGVVWRIDDPVKEDFGAVLMLERGKEVFTITMSWQGDKSWAMVFGQMRGCLGWFFNRKPAVEPLREIKLMVNDVVFGDAENFRNRNGLEKMSFRVSHRLSSSPAAVADAATPSMAVCREA